MSRIIAVLVALSCVLATSSSHAQLKREADSPREFEALPGSAIVSVGDVFNTGKGWIENTTVAFGPGEHPAALEGRIIFSSGRSVYVTDLEGNAISSVSQPLSESSTPYPINDNHIVKLSNGDVLHTFEGVSWDDPWLRPPGWSQWKLPPRPDWWDVTAQWGAKGDALAANPNRPGARGVIYMFRSSDAGSSWIQLPGLDALTMSVPDSAGNNPRVGEFGAPAALRCRNDVTEEEVRCDGNNAVMITSVGGPDGHYAYADPYSDRVFISTRWSLGKSDCALFGADVDEVAEKLADFLDDPDSVAQDWQDLFTENNGKWRACPGRIDHLIFASDDHGDSWKVISRKESQGEWRRPMTSTPSGTVGLARWTSDRKVVLSTFSRDTNWTNLDHEYEIATVPSGEYSGILGGIKSPIYGLKGYRDIARVHDPEGFNISMPFWEPNHLHRVYGFALNSGTGGRVVSSDKQWVQTGADTLQGTFIEGLPDDEVSVFYWRDRIPDAAAGEKYMMRFQVFHGSTELLGEPGVLSIRGGQPYTWPFMGVSPGSYMGGAVYRPLVIHAEVIGDRVIGSAASVTAVLDKDEQRRLERERRERGGVLLSGQEKSVRHFIAPWIENGVLVFNRITVTLTGPYPKLTRPHVSEPDPRPNRIIPIRKGTQGANSQVEGG